MKPAEIEFPSQSTDKLWLKVWKLAGADLWDNRRTLFSAYLFGIVAVAALLLLPWPLKLIIDHVMAGYDLPEILTNIQAYLLTQGITLSKEDKIIIFATAYTFIAVFVTLCGSAEKMAGARVRENMVLRIRDKMLLHFQSLSSFQRSNYRSGDMGLYILVDVHHLVRLLTKTIPLIFRHLAIALFTLSIMFWLEPWLAGAGLFMVVILAILVRFHGSRLRCCSRYKRNQEGIVSGYTQECVKGMTTVQALSAEDYVRQKFLHANRASLQAGITETAAAVGMERTMQIINGFAVALIMGGGAIFVLHGQMTVGDLTVFVAYMVQLLKPVEKINEMASAVSRGLTRAEHLTSLLNMKPAIQDKPKTQSITNCQGIIEFHSVSFNYPNQASEQLVLHNISFKLQPGQLTVLTGSSGSGKSTLINLILRQLTPSSGNILIDDKLYDEVSLTSLRAQFSVMLQQHHLFAGKLCNALWLNNNTIDEELIWQALAQVDMENYIRQLPLELETILDEEGHNFSGGQRARLSLARALLLNRPILLLDEPLANIDVQSQQVIINALEQIRQYKTCLIISHMPALIDRANQLLKLENGVLSIQPSKSTEDKKNNDNEILDLLL
ncbi:MAG: ABC transporter ATP-binding protein/permease [Methylococcaceae bacterium]|nr:ABC transporter ATP-binding protein/permease [Methylococcaceae bacterium]